MRRKFKRGRPIRPDSHLETVTWETPSSFPKAACVRFSDLRNSLIWRAHSCFCKDAPVFAKIPLDLGLYVAYKPCL
jgi:hypothetical protein